MRDQVEAAFFLKGRTIGFQQRRVDVQIRGNSPHFPLRRESPRVLEARNRIHRRDSHFRRVDFLSSPVLRSVAPDHIPTQIVHRYDLRRHCGYGRLRPDHAPYRPIVTHMQITNIIERPYSAGPNHAHPNHRLIVVGVKGRGIRALQRSICAQAAVASRHVASERFQIRIAAGIKRSISSLEIVRLNVGHSTFTASSGVDSCRTSTAELRGARGGVRAGPAQPRPCPLAARGHPVRGSRRRRS